jgi:uncharacterized protein
MENKFLNGKHLIIKNMDPLTIINKHYKIGTELYRVYLLHAKSVRDKALSIAKRIPELNPDINFISESAMLHDIGIKFTYSPKIGCNGKHKYIEHGVLGRELLEKEGLFKHGLVCERHVGIGLTIKDITDQNLPLPLRDMVPQTIEEEIVCFADKFFSKKPSLKGKERTIKEVREHIADYNKEKILLFDNWCKKFKEF